MNKSRIKLGIYGIALLMMGVIGVSGALATMGAHFRGSSQTMIQNIISIPCLVVIPVTILVGKIMGSVSKKAIALTGILLFLIGGVVPAVLGSLTIILVFRAIFGVGIGIIQTIASALVADNFEGAERDRVQGNVTSAQMLGCCIMVFAGGWLGAVKWNLAFLVYALAGISLLLAVFCLPFDRPSGKTVEHEDHAEKAGMTKGAWIWAFTMFVLFIGAQVYSVYLAYIVQEKALGTSIQSGNAMAFFAIGGIICGILFGRLAEKARNLTLSVGLILIVISYAVIVLASGMVFIYLGAFLFGIGLSVCMPCIIVGAANSTAAAASGFAIAVVTCMQNLAQFICPYIFNPVAAVIGNGSNNNEIVFILGAALVFVMFLVAFFWGIRANRRISS